MEVNNLEQIQIQEPETKEVRVISLEEIREIRREIRDNQLVIDNAESEFEKATKKQREAKEKIQNPVYDKIEELKKKEKELFEEACNQAVFSEDPFLRSVKVKGDSYKEGPLKIIRHIKDTRTLNQSAFQQQYPEEFKKIAKVELGKADNEVGKNKVNELCNIARSYTFEFYDSKEVKE